MVSSKKHITHLWISVTKHVQYLYSEKLEVWWEKWKKTYINGEIQHVCYFQDSTLLKCQSQPNDFTIECKM